MRVEGLVDVGTQTAEEVLGKRDCENLFQNAMSDLLDKIQILQRLTAVEAQNVPPPSAMETRTDYLELRQSVQHADGVAVGDAERLRHDPLQRYRTYLGRAQGARTGTTS